MPETSSLVDLIVRTARRAASFWRALLAAVLVLSALHAAAQSAEAWRVARYRADSLDDAAMQRDVMHLDSLERVPVPDAVAQTEIRRIRERISTRLTLLSGRRSPSAYWLTVGPVVGASWVISAFATLMGFVFALGFSLSDTAHTFFWRAGETLRRFPPFVLLCTAQLGLSLLWIPATAIVLAQLQVQPLSEAAANMQMFAVFLGYLTAVLLLPRLVPAPVLMLQEGLSVRGALSASLVATRGHWGKILGNTLTVALGLALAESLVLSSLSDVVGRASVLMLPARALLLQASVMLLALFLGELSATVLAHPLPSEEDLAEPSPVTASAVAA